jgi:[FeFe] hydrogenase H-cluster maturation GTPase HydF
MQVLPRQNSKERIIMQSTPRANRLHIAIFGKRNAGKSSLINAITNQQIALVSDLPGTTTDPVFKSMELLPLGPVVFIDTAGIDDEGEIGQLRVQKTKEIIERTDLALLIFTDEKDFGLEKEWYNMLIRRRINVIGVINKIDERYLDIEPLLMEFDIPFIKVSSKNLLNINSLKKAIQTYAPTEFERSTLLGDLIKPKDLVLLVAPQDIQAPKGRLILPQAQVIRDILDNHACSLTVTVQELEHVLSLLKQKPDLVVTDSQVFKQVNEILPSDIPLTSFSILMARQKGDLKAFIEGADVIDSLQPGDAVLIAEACTHHPLLGDIGREKLPAWLEQKAGGKLDITMNVGSSFPEDLQKYKLVIHCGGCMFNRKQMMSRVVQSESSHVPITNYGVAIAHIHNMLDRVTGLVKA